jgi:hypothetical protein
MRKLVAASILACLVTLPVLAGDVNMPPAPQPPPPCREDCGTGSAIKPPSLKTEIIILVVKLLTRV